MTTRQANPCAAHVVTAFIQCGQYSLDELRTMRDAVQAQLDCRDPDGRREADEARTVEEVLSLLVVSAAQTKPDALGQLGRGGKPSLTEGVRYVLEVHGPMNQEGIAQKLLEHGLVNQSDGLAGQVLTALRQGKNLFQKVPGQSRFWRVM